MRQKIKYALIYTSGILAGLCFSPYRASYFPLVSTLLLAVALWVLE